MLVSIRRRTGWDEVLSAARATVWKNTDLGKEPSDRFKREMCQSEHSPLRELTFRIKIEGVRYWVAMHLVRHGVGFEPYVSTQRGDRIDLDVPRDELKQGALVNLEITLNAQSLISVSQRRMCHMASEETRAVWYRVIGKLKAIEPILASFCVPSCVYRGFCPEPMARETCKLKWEPWREKYLKEI